MQVIPWVISGLMLLFSILTFAFNRSNDKTVAVQEQEKRFDDLKESLLKANLKLDQVCGTTNETRTDIKVLSKDMQNLEKRVTIVENDVKTLKRKVDEQ